ncbi:f-box and wd repeat domain-containing 7 [Anaeramoeba ignava]|uniref:F-box and wd repeat domain-containing 7 n=1 Tax=Anaeramoeba ignava TaxID=1746090 RepID=A0A9Q0RI92_ANAIG|nr:f-box and wd repeat domain-containing 7 [Anaeramoeba ignava]|eukprot:Anaeramoba_ignava/a609857_7.p1 GENE.a609857_7~~a609857_7.p1  ORF type:complete len:409 (-),score=126.54 a609857_7:56-1282(-)
MEKLPPELVFYIIQFLSPFDLLKFSQTCKLINEYVNDSFLWKSRLRSTFPYFSWFDYNFPDNLPWSLFAAKRLIWNSKWFRSNPKKRHIQDFDNHMTSTCVQFYSPDSVLCASIDGSLLLFSVRGNKIVELCKDHIGPVWSVSADSVHGNVITGGKDTTIHFYKQKQKENLINNNFINLNNFDEKITHHSVLKFHQKPVSSVKIVEDHFAISGSYDEMFCFWDLEKESLIFNKKCQNSIWCLDHLDSLTSIGSKNGKLEFIDLQTQNTVCEFIDDGVAISRVLFSDPHSVISSSYSGFICLWDLRSKKLASKIFANPRGISSIQFDNQNNLIISSGFDPQLRFWDLRGFKETRDLLNLSDKEREWIVSFNFFDGFIVYSLNGGELGTLNFQLPTLQEIEEEIFKFKFK